MTVHITGPGSLPVPEDAILINTTSRSTNWSQGLSPFFLGPCKLYGDYVAQNVENGWQYSKVFEYHTEMDGSVGERYFSWAKKGWDSKRADRYPMGRGVLPLYSYWDGKTMPYVEARKAIYVPLYAEAVRQTKAFERLKKIVQESGSDVYLLDFDGYDHKSLGINYSEVLNNPDRKMGHGFVLGMLLDGLL